MSQTSPLECLYVYTVAGRFARKLWMRGSGRGRDDRSIREETAWCRKIDGSGRAWTTRRRKKKETYIYYIDCVNIREYSKKDVDVYSGCSKSSTLKRNDMQQLQVTLELVFSIGGWIGFIKENKRNFKLWWPVIVDAALNQSRTVWLFSNEELLKRLCSRVSIPVGWRQETINDAIRRALAMSHSDRLLYFISQ
jgi:hypothetical protein